MMSLVFDGRSAQFGEQFRVTHFLPMYYMIFHDGINTQFWGRYTEHLPIGWRPGQRPASTPDWKPQEFSLTDLRDSDYLLFQSVAEDSPRDQQAATRRITALLERSTETIECRGLWCLYRIRR
jgi:hypothetical protein